MTSQEIPQCKQVKQSDMTILGQLDRWTDKSNCLTLLAHMCGIIIQQKLEMQLELLQLTCMNPPTCLMYPATSSPIFHTFLSAARYCC